MVGMHHDVIVLSRKPTNAPWPMIAWDAKNLGGWRSVIDGADVVINLAGRSVSCRYTSENRTEMMDSRVDSTRAVGKAIAQVANPPRVWLQASTATIYSHRFDAPNDEVRGILGGNEPNAPASWKFSIEVAKAWEHAVVESDTSHTRKVLMRAAMVMSPDSQGVFDVLLGLVKRGLGGTDGDGQQYTSWIHDKDFVRSVFWLIERELSGPVNLASPNPIPNAEFMKTIRQVARVPVGLPATRWMLEIGAMLLKTETELILKSRRVIPGKLLASGFVFEFPTWYEAAKDLFERWKA